MGSRARSGWVLLGLVALPGAARGEELSAGVIRRPVLLALRAAEGLAQRANRSSLMIGVSRALRAHTDLEPMMVEELEESRSAIQACRSGLGCLVDLVRRDDSVDLVASLDVDPVAYADDEDAVGARAVLVEVRPARRLRPGPERDRTILQASAVAPLGGIRVEGDGPDQEKLGEEVVIKGWRSMLEATGHWEPFAALEIKVEHSGLTVAVDGRELGKSSAPTTRITGLAAGPRRVTLTDPDGHYTAFEADVTLQAGSTASLVPAMIKVRSLMTVDGRGVSFWSGLALGVAGLGISSYAVLGGASNSALCVTAAGGECSLPSRYRRFGEQSLSAQGFAEPSAAEGSGLAILPLGVGLLVAGGISTVGALLLDDDGLVWLSPIVGLAAGTGTYGLMLAVEPSF